MRGLYCTSPRCWNDHEAETRVNLCRYKPSRMNTPIVPFTSQDLTSRRNVKRVKIQSFRLPRTVYTFTVRGGGIITIIHPLRKNRIRHHFPMMSPYEHPNFINHCPISGRRKFRGMVYVKKNAKFQKKNITSLLLSPCAKGQFHAPIHHGMVTRRQAPLVHLATRSF